MWCNTMEHFIANFNDSGTDNEIKAARDTSPEITEE